MADRSAFERIETELKRTPVISEWFKGWLIGWILEVERQAYQRGKDSANG